MAKTNIHILMYGLLECNNEATLFRKYGLPVVTMGGQTFSFRWLLEMKDRILLDVNNSPEEYSLLEKIYKNRDMHAPSKSLCALSRGSETISAALLQLVEQVDWCTE